MVQEIHYLTRLLYVFCQVLLDYMPCSVCNRDLCRMQSVITTHTEYLADTPSNSSPIPVLLVKWFFSDLPKSRKTSLSPAMSEREWLLDQSLQVRGRFFWALSLVVHPASQPIRKLGAPSFLIGQKAISLLTSSRSERGFLISLLRGNL